MKYTTPDLYFAGYIIASGDPIVGSDRSGRQVSFHFELEDAEWDELRQAFFSGSGFVSGMAYANAIKALKSLVHVT